MFTRAHPYIFHIELTDKCNAGCPMCPRTDAMNFCKPDRKKVFNVELSLDDFKQHFSDEFCAGTEEIVFGGAYGDPLAASQLLEIADHLTARGVRLAVSTNGSLRKPEWWRRLGEMMKRTGSRLELHIDGLADTNPLYRVKTDFAKIIENAEAGAPTIFPAARPNHRSTPRIILSAKRTMPTIHVAIISMNVPNKARWLRRKTTVPMPRTPPEPIGKPYTR